MSMTYADARTDVMRSVSIVLKLIDEEGRRVRRRELLNLLIALQRELAQLDSLAMTARTEKYHALTLRFSDAADELDKAKAEAENLAANLNLAANVINALGRLAGVLRGA